MSRHSEAFGTWSPSYMLGDNYDEGVGAFEFGNWHTQYREGLLQQAHPRGGTSGPVWAQGPAAKVKGRYVTPTKAVVPVQHQGPRQPFTPPGREPEPVPTPKGSGGSKKKRRAAAGGSTPLLVALGRWQHRGTP